MISKLKALVIFSKGPEFSSQHQASHYHNTQVKSSKDKVLFLKAKEEGRK